MCFLTADDVRAVHAQLKDRYDLALTNAFSVDDGFSVDCPILVGKAHGQELWLYEDGGDFILDVMDAAHTRGTHWHPDSVAEAVRDVAEFMEGRADYTLQRFRRS
ncbi:MAG: hypothetical protein IJE07_00655 [Clostridia bacterium]|nr:hypothetical protein [Clostridia bacterium]